MRLATNQKNLAFVPGSCRKSSAYAFAQIVRMSSSKAPGRKRSAVESATEHHSPAQRRVHPGGQKV